ncbi:SpoIIE family protein phosphatase [Streptomyces sp. NPDC057539]|uniref:SpoIIE family protein phosphatase n=1 Tax=Streptomyces sp. NPDC057539 TaxID=3346159 RepID=UPI0036A391A1
MTDRTELVAVVRPDGTVALWTEAAERLWGTPAEEVLGRPVGGLLSGADVPVPPGAEGAPAEWSGPVELRRRDGGSGGKVNLRVSPLPVAESGGDWQVWEAGPVEPSGAWPDPATLRTLYGHAPQGVIVWDRELRCYWQNDAVDGMGLLVDGPHLGRRVEELLVPGRPESLEIALRRVLDGASPSSNLEWVVPDATGRGERVLSLSLLRLDAPDSRAPGVCLIAVDVSETAVWQRRNLLLEAGTRIGTTLDVMTTAQEMADAAVPAVADYVTVDLADTFTADDEPLDRLEATDTRIPAFYRAAAASVRPDLPESLWPRGEPVYVPPQSPFTAVLLSGAPHFEPLLDTSPGGWLDNDPDRARVIHATGMHSLMVVPLRVCGTLLGVAVFVRTTNPVPFAKADLTLAQDLAARTAVSLDHASRYRREHTAALALQRDLLPHRLYGGVAVEVASRYLPADTRSGVGGDWYDVFPLSGDRVGLVVGDVVGHGIHAAATMGRIRTAVHTLTNLELSPDVLLARLDELVDELERDQLDDGLTMTSVGATCVYAVYNPASRRCTVASAGHLPPAVVSPEGGVEFADVPTGAPLGVGLGRYESVEVDVAEGSVIALYTDGLVETRAESIDRGLDRLRAALTLPRTTLEDLCVEVTDRMANGQRSDDDIALLLARTRARTGCPGTRNVVRQSEVVHQSEALN